jgi:hypothetical protein
MADNKFTVYPGKFTCHTCKEEVLSLRSWIDTMELTWMCSKKHLTKVSLKPKRKKDYEREKREQKNRS